MALPILAMGVDDDGGSCLGRCELFASPGEGGSTDDRRSRGCASTTSRRRMIAWTSSPSMIAEINSGPIPSIRVLHTVGLGPSAST